MKSYFIGFDLGSHASKGVIIGENGNPLATKSLEHDTIIPKPGWQEQDPEIWWEEFKHITRCLLEKSAVDPSLVRGVGVAGFVPGLVIIDNSGQSIRPAIMHTDIRAVSQLKNINRILETKISHGFLMPKLFWIRENEEENYSSISKILVPHSYIVQKLTGKYSCDRDTATIFGGIYDEISGEWSEKKCHTLGMNVEILPELYNADSVVGTLGSEVSQLTGLTEGTPVITGTGDTFAALIGCGAVLPGDMMIYLGTSGTQLFIEGDLDTYTNGPHFGSGKADFTGRIISCGDSMQHYRDILGFDDWSLPDNKALEIEPGSEGLFIFPHLKQKSDRETSKGNLETIFGLETSHCSWHIYRAVLEGIACNLKTSFMGYETKVKRLILSGGGAKSRVLREIISSILDKDIYHNPLGDGARGAALLASHSISGVSLKEVSARISSSAEKTKPNKDDADIYKKHYKKYIELRTVIERLYKNQETYDNE